MYMQWEERTALMLASEHGHLDVVRELLTAQANVNTKDKVSSVSDLRRMNCIPIVCANKS